MERGGTDARGALRPHGDGNSQSAGAQILLAGGYGVGPYANGCDVGATAGTAELYDTATSAFVSPPPPNLPAHVWLGTATLSADGQAVLIAGGYNGQIDNPSACARGRSKCSRFAADSG